MSKRIKLGLWLLVAAGLCGLGVYRSVYRKAIAKTAQSVVSLVFGSKDCPASGLLRAPRPGKGRLDTVLAFDQADGFYFVTSKRDIAYEKQVAHPPHAAVINVLSVRGNVQRLVPLQRKDGRLVRYLCDFLSVSPSGKRWWTARRPYESPSDLREGPSPKAVLTAYDESGKALQEWTLPQTVNEVRLLQAVRENQAYVVIDYVGVGAKRQQSWAYQIGAEQPQQKVSCPEFQAWSGAFVTSSGQLWSLRSTPSGSIEVVTWKLSQLSHVFATIQKETIQFFPTLFWHAPNQGVFIYRHVPSENASERKAAKAVYRVGAGGTIHKLFETPDVLPSKPGQQVRAGQLLKADENFIWMEMNTSRATNRQSIKSSRCPIGDADW